MVSESKTEAARLWSVPDSAETSLYIKMAGQKDRRTIAFVYLGCAVSSDANISSKSSATKALRVHASESMASTIRSAQRHTLFETQLLKAETVETMLNRYATWMLRPEDSGNLRTAHKEISTARRTSLSYGKVTLDTILMHTELC